MVDMVIYKPPFLLYTLPRKLCRTNVSNPFTIAGSYPNATSYSTLTTPCTCHNDSSTPFSRGNVTIELPQVEFYRQNMVPLVHIQIGSVVLVKSLDEIKVASPGQAAVAAATQATQNSTLA